MNRYFWIGEASKMLIGEYLYGAGFWRTGVNADLPLWLKPTLGMESVFEIIEVFIVCGNSLIRI